ncbi:hypothetical protein JRO89_XS05G0199500 [Xanthoceras sorbifolium]|uniref:anthranilate synthase n=1 Tax=Xanthoceras sorbifolium TaxID=99658 RepID=A0ABQ8I337_9ROSI|nr:hypothetical protein JRO89_XS05G0199500 [Xanthoceras sorbifolium]
MANNGNDEVSGSAVNSPSNAPTSNQARLAALEAGQVEMQEDQVELRQAMTQLIEKFDQIERKKSALLRIQKPFFRNRDDVESHYSSYFDEMNSSSHRDNVLRQNNQKQNYIPNKESSTSKASVYNQPNRKTKSIGGSNGLNWTLNKVITNSGTGFRKTSSTDILELEINQSCPVFNLEPSLMSECCSDNEDNTGDSKQFSLEQDHGEISCHPTYACQLVERETSITRVNALSLLKCVQEKNYSFLESFCKKGSQKWWKANAGAGYWCLDQYLLFDAEWEHEALVTDGLVKLPVDSRSDGILLFNRLDVFIADNLQLKDAFVKSFCHQCRSGKLLLMEDLVIDNHFVTYYRKNPRGVLISPGPGAPQDSGISLQTVLELGPTVPLFGVCMGLQCIGEAFGGKIVRSPLGVMHGKSSLVYYDEKGEDGLFAGLSNPFTAGRYHSLVIEKDSFPSEELEVTAWTEDGLIMAARHKVYKHLQGVQFHPESIITSEGKTIVRNFIKLIERTEAAESQN